MSLDEARGQAMIAAEKVGERFDVLLLDRRNDHDARDAPGRVARMTVRELLRGRFPAPPGIAGFENAGGADHLTVTGPIAVRPTCAHHLKPIGGGTLAGVVPAPDGGIIGLSRHDRVVGHCAGRLQVREKPVKQGAGLVDDVTGPLRPAVRIGAVPPCRTHRGACAGHANRMVGPAYRGGMLAGTALGDGVLRGCHALGRETR